MEKLCRSLTDYIISECISEQRTVRFNNTLIIFFFWVIF